MFSTCPYVNLFVRCQSCENDILKTDVPVLLQTGTGGPRGGGIKQSTLGSKSYYAAFRFGDLAEASVSTPFTSRFSSYM